MRTADPSADGRRSAAIFATVKLPSAGAYRLTSPGDTLLECELLHRAAIMRSVSAQSVWPDNVTKSGTVVTHRSVSALCPRETDEPIEMTIDWLVNSGQPKELCTRIRIN